MKNPPEAPGRYTVRARKATVKIALIARNLRPLFHCVCNRRSIAYLASNSSIDALAAYSCTFRIANRALALSSYPSPLAIT